MNQCILILLLLIINGLSSISHASPLPGPTLSNAYHGWSVDVEGDLAVVGTPLHWVAVDGGHANAGSVHVYRQQAGEWLLEQVLNPGDLADGDEFGNEVLIHQGRIVVAAPYHDPEIGGEPVVDAGAVYVFEQQDQAWQVTEKIVRPDAMEEDLMGNQIAADIDRLFISTAEYGLPEDTETGAIYVYDLIAGDWTEPAVIRNDIPYMFGGVPGNWAMSFHQGQLVTTVSVYGMGQSTGYVHIYTEQEGQWTLQQAITSPNDMPGDFFGAAVSVYDNHLLIGASGEAGSQGELNTGAAYLYRRIGDHWNLERKFTPQTPSQSSNFGIDVQMSHDQLIIGQRHTEVINNANPGKVYVFDRQGLDWQVSRVLTADSSPDHDDFGQAISLDHDRLVVGAPYSKRRQGMAYVYEIQAKSERFVLNEGLNGNWYNPETEGQGVFLDVKPELNYAYAGWFTYDTEPTGDDVDTGIGLAGHRWLVGNGRISQSTQSISFDLFYAAGGLFDDPTAVDVPAEPYGSMTLVFDSCAAVRVNYQIFAAALSGSFSMTRPTAGSVGLCEQFQTGFQPAADAFDVSLNGHWYNPDTLGQGLFIEQFAGTDQAFMGWFTHNVNAADDTTASLVGAIGQRWLVGSGRVDSDQLNVIEYDLLYSGGGLFDSPIPVTVYGLEGYGTLRIEFLDCAHARVDYALSALGLTGGFEVIKLFTETSEHCPAVD